MSMPILSVCPCTLAQGFDTYSPSCLKKLFYGKSVSHILPFDSPKKNEESLNAFIENIKHISLSGFQPKLSLILDKNTLRLTRNGEQGSHILKPIPIMLKKNDQAPANEHLTMQIAKQVFGIKTAENGLIFFQDGEPAYITKRFDVSDIKSKSKLGQEDFASLAGKTTLTSDEKYDYSYEEIGEIIRQYMPAWRIEIEKFFSLVVFNYVFSNGDAHLKNFSILESTNGDYFLSPAYDLINTRFHVDDTDFALRKGLFSDNYRSKDYQKNNHPSKLDFIELAKRIGVSNNRIDDLLLPFLTKQALIESLVNRSFLSESNKRGYLIMYNTKRNYLIG